MGFVLEFSFSSLLPFALFILTIFAWLYASSRPRRTLPPSPPKFPIVGNLFQLGLYPHLTLHSLSRKYGQLMLIHLASKPVLVASSADAAHEIMKTHDLIFSNRPKSNISDRLFYGSKDIAAAKYGEYWRQVRSICVLQLLSNKRVQSFRCIREEETSIMVEKIMRRCTSSPSGAINLSEILMTLTNDLICRVALGRKYSDYENGRKSMEILKEFGEILGTFDVGDFIPRLAWLNRFNGLNAKVEKVAKQIDEFLESVIEGHKHGKKGEANANIDDTTEERGLDLVDILLQIQKESSTGFALEPDSLKAIILDMFAAGTDTTYTVMEWAMTELLRYPNILKKLQLEARRVAQKSEITEDDLDKMHYLKAVIKETLRLHTPVPLLVPRESTEHVKVMGYDVPAGTRVMINAWAISRDPKVWKNPEEFQPDRFLNSAIDFRGLNFELIPFGAGRRGCPGTSFAMAINELALARLVHKFDFALPDGVEIEDLDMSESTGLTIHRKHPLLAVARPRSA